MFCWLKNLWNEKLIPCLMVGFLVVPKVELGTWEFGRVMVNGSFWVNFCIVAVKKKSHANATKVFLAFFWQILPYFQWKLLNVDRFTYYILKSYQYKTGFWEKIYNPSRIEILMLGDFQNVKGFLFWIGSSSIFLIKDLELESHLQYPPNSNTHIARSFMLKQY